MSEEDFSLFLNNQNIEFTINIEGEEDFMRFKLMLKSGDFYYYSGCDKENLPTCAKLDVVHEPHKLEVYLVTM